MNPGFQRLICPRGGLIRGHWHTVLYAIRGGRHAQPNGYVDGVSGWITADSMRQVGLSLDLRF